MGDICETTSGGTPLKSREDFYYPQEIPWINSGEVRNGEIYQANKYISRIGLEKSSAKIVPANSVLVAMYGATAGQVGLLKIEASTNQAICSILPNERFNPKFLYYVLSSKTNDLIEMSVGGAQPNISQGIIKNIEIPLPPLDVQEEIVKELDGYQAVIDGAQKVVDNWKPTLPINQNWEKVKLGDVCELTYGYTDTALEAGDTRFIRITDIDIFGQIKDNDCKYINSNNETDKYLLHNNDIIVARTGATYGKTALFKGDYKAVYASFLIKLDFDKTKVYNPYYWAFAQSQDYINQAAKLVSGVAQPQFNANAIKNIEFYIPSIEIQKEIVLKIQEEEKAIEECKKLIKLHQEKINTKIQSIWGDNCENNN